VAEENESNTKKKKRLIKRWLELCLTPKESYNAAMKEIRASK